MGWPPRSNNYRGERMIQITKLASDKLIESVSAETDAENPVVRVYQAGIG